MLCLSHTSATRQKTHIATRLRKAEAPTSPDNFTEHRKFFEQLEKTKLREAKLKNFRKQRRRSLQLEKTKLRGGKICSNNGTDGNTFNGFMEQRRKSLQLEKNQVQEAKNYMNNYRTDGNEHDRSIKRRRKSLHQEKPRLQDENKDLSKGNDLLTSSCRRRNSTGSKPSSVPSNSPVNNTIRTPKSHSKENDKNNSNDVERIKRKNLSFDEQTEHKKLKVLDAGREAQSPGRNKVRVSPKVHLDESRDASSTKEEDFIEPNNEMPQSDCAIAEEISVYQKDAHNTHIDLASPVKSHFTGGQNDIEHNGCNSSDSELPEAHQSKVSQKEEGSITIRQGQSDRENSEPEQNITQRSQSPQHSFECCDEEISVPCDNNDNVETIFDPYYDEEEDESPFRVRNDAEEIADVSKPVKQEDCFACSIM